MSENEHNGKPGISGRPDTPVGHPAPVGQWQPGVTNELRIKEHHLPHWQMGGSIYFITFRSARGPLPEQSLHLVTAAIIHDHGIKHHLHLAVVLPDHAHILLQPLEISPGIWYDLSIIMKPIKGVSSRRINQLLGTQGNVWIPESFDRIVRDEKEFEEKWNYIINNPVKAGLVEDPYEYKFLVFGEDIKDSGDQEE